jgi:hypothetical protein
MCSERTSVFTGWNVPMPTWSVRKACGIALSSSGVKWRPAVGLREDGLVARVVLRVGGAEHVGRNGKLAAREIDLVTGLDYALAGRCDFDHLQAGAAGIDFCPDAHASTGFHEAFPTAWHDLLEKKQFDATVLAVHACADDLGIVEHDEVARAHIRRKIREHAVRDRPRGAVEHEHARGVAPRERPRGDQLAGQLEIVIGKPVHGLPAFTFSRA